MTYLQRHRTPHTEHASPCARAVAQRLNREQGKTVMVLHGLDQIRALERRDHRHMGGEVYAQGRPEDVPTLELLTEVSGLETHILSDPGTGRPHIIPYASTR